MTTETVPTQTATEVVFETLLRDIVCGTYPASTRLPAERDLAKNLKASRPTLREALRRLAEWNLIKTKRGSGIIVQPITDWMIDVLPAYLRYAAHKTPSLLRVHLQDLLQLRRVLVCEILSLVATRITPEACKNARIAVERAWQSRNNTAEFAVADLDIFRALVHSTQFLPGLWTINKLSSIYVDLSKTLGSIVTPPDTYASAWNGVLDALAQGDAKTATERLNHYFEAHDAQLTALLKE